MAGFIAAKLGSDIVNIDLTDRKADFKGVALNGDDVAVIACRRMADACLHRQLNA